MARAVRFDRYGGVEELYLAEVDVPRPGPGEAVVAVRAAGINPGEAAIRRGLLDAVWPATFPSGQGTDLAGVVTDVGPAGPDRRDPGFRSGDEVLGWTDGRASQADQVVVPTDHLARKPAGLPWTVAGSLFVVGTTACASVRAVDPRRGETVVVSAAAGGVGSLAVQLVRARGATVVGIAGPANHDWLASLGAIPVDHGGDPDELAEHVGKAAGGGVDAVIDTFGEEYVRLGVDLGVPPDRINTIIAFDAAQRYGAKTAGSSTAASADILAELAALAADGRLEVPIAATYPLEEVQDAFRELERRHTHGKIVLVP
jgi:NADPH:quinone reductase-like Zn-dependent oxidoreductase